MNQFEVNTLDTHTVCDNKLSSRCQSRNVVTGGGFQRNQTPHDGSALGMVNYEKWPECRNLFGGLEVRAVEQTTAKKKDKRKRIN